MAKPKPKFNARFLFLAVIFVLGAYVILPQLGDFKTSGQLLRHPRPSWLAAAVLFMGLTYFAAAATYYWLAYKKLKYLRTVLVQLAAMFINRLLPGGVGALGANYVYLKKSHSSPGEAGTIVAINNFLGFAGHGVLTLLVLLAYSGHAVSLGENKGPSSPVVQYVLIGLFVGVLLGLVVGRRRLIRLVKQSGRQLARYRQQPWKIVAALMSSMILTICNVLCLYCCMYAMGASFSLFAVFLIFSFGVTAGTATPTPGGLGGYEAAIMAGFIAYGATGPLALAIALMYRFVSYWLSLIAGSVAFGISQKKRYI